MGLSQSGVDTLLNSSGAGGAARAGGPGMHRSASPVAVPPAPRKPAISRILNLSVPVTVTLAHRLMSIESIMEITLGTIIEFDVPFDSELVLEVAGHPIGNGHAVKIGENFGLRVTRIGTVCERIQAMGKS